MLGFGRIRDVKEQRITCHFGGGVWRMYYSPMISVRRHQNRSGYVESKSLINLRAFEASDLKEAMRPRTEAVFIPFRRAGMRSLLRSDAWDCYYGQTYHQHLLLFTLLAFAIF